MIGTAMILGGAALVSWWTASRTAESKADKMEAKMIEKAAELSDEATKAAMVKIDQFLAGRAIPAVDAMEARALRFEALEDQFVAGVQFVREHAEEAKKLRTAMDSSADRLISALGLCTAATAKAEAVVTQGKADHAKFDVRMGELAAQQKSVEATRSQLRDLIAAGGTEPAMAAAAAAAAAATVEAPTAAAATVEAPPAPPPSPKPTPAPTEPEPRPRPQPGKPKCGECGRKLRGGECRNPACPVNSLAVA